MLLALPMEGHQGVHRWVLYETSRRTLRHRLFYGGSPAEYQIYQQEGLDL